MSKFLTLGLLSAGLLLAACSSAPQPVADEVATPALADARIEPISQAGESAHAWKHEKELQAAIQWLVKNQNKDGSWGGPVPQRPNDIYLGGLNSLKGFGNASVALCCIGLAMQQPSTPEIDNALVKGFAYLADAPIAGRVKGDTFYNTWAHTYVLEAISRNIEDKRLASMRGKLKARAEDELRRLLRLQALNGGWAYYDFDFKTAVPSGDLSTSFNAGAALVALKTAKDAGFNVPDEAIERGTLFLRSQRIGDAAYLYSDSHKYYPVGRANQPQGSIGRAQSCNCGLAVWGKLPSHATVEAGMAEFFRLHHFIEIGRQRQFPHEAWYGTAPYYYYFGHYYAALNLGLYAKREQREADAANLAARVAKTQDKDGCFWDYPLYGYPKAYGTGYGVAILTHCKRNLESKP